MTDKMVGRIAIAQKKTKKQKQQTTFNKREWIKYNKGIFYIPKIRSCVLVFSTQMR